MINNQGPVIKKLDDDIDYEKQDFESLSINNYEIVVAVSKIAREINTKAQKYLGPEYEIRPANIALKKLRKDDITFVYDEVKDDTGDTGKKTT